MDTPKLPALPKSTFWLENLKLLTKPHETLEYQRKRYGDIYVSNINSSGALQVRIGHPDGVKAVFSSNIQQMDSGQDAGIKLALLGENSLLALTGSRHQRERKLLMPSFHGDRMKLYGELIRDITEKVTSKLALNKAFNVRSTMQEISFEVILKAVFGIADENRCKDLTKLIIAIQNPRMPILIGLMIIFPILKQDLGSWSPWGKFLRQRQAIDDLIYAEIKERRSKTLPDATDILSLMISARDEQGESMTDIEVRDELMTLFIAGHDTTATALAWAFYWIHYMPEVLKKLLQELDGLGENLNLDEIVRLPYLNAVCLETLRINPVANFTLPRVVKTPIEIMGYTLVPETIVTCCIYHIHHREDLYPEPNKFRPERFINHQFSPYEYLPFGGGNRRCIGYAFALYEMKLVIATILSHFELELVEKKPLKTVRQGILTGPEGGVQMSLKGKRKPN